jgi:hypothetical protein
MAKTKLRKAYIVRKSGMITHAFFNKRKAEVFAKKCKGKITESRR